MRYLEARVGGRVVRWVLRTGTYIVGRDAGCQIVIDDAALSRQHARLEVGDAGVIAFDLGSKNGIWFDGQRVERVELPYDRWLTMGTVLLAVREGVSLTSLDVNATPTPPEPAPMRAVTGGPEPPSTDPPMLAAAGWIERAADTLADTGDESATAMLALAAAACGSASTALVSRAGSGWCVHALHGPALPPEFDEATLPAGRDAAEVPLGSETLLALRFGDAWVVFFPWDPRGPLRPEARLAAAMCALLRQPPGSPRVPNAGPDEVGDAGPQIVGVSDACRQMLAEVDRLARTDLPVLLLGESGTGKELLARRVHSRSPRHRGPFVALNCAALPRELIEAELFGIEKGVATGVSARVGRFALASGGTLFLDEIGDLPDSLQPKLLRALETSEVTPLGAPAPLRIDVRVVAATNQDLEQRASANLFRRDLLYRIAGAVVSVPALRDRAEDILPLARTFASEAARAQGRNFHGLDIDAARHLLGHTWPGNVRELRHAIARAVALSDDGIVHSDQLPRTVSGSTDTARGDALLGLTAGYREARARFERFYFSQLLERSAGNRTEAARRAGLSRSAFYEKLGELGLD